MKVKAASLNHHDLWSLRGVGLSASALPMILGCDAAGIDAEGREVIVHSVIGSAQAGGGMRRSIPDAVCCPSDTKAPSRNGSPCRR